MIKILGWVIAIGFALSYFGILGIPTNDYISYITMAAALYAAGASFDNYQKLTSIEDELKSFKKEMEIDLKAVHRSTDRIDRNQY